MLRIAALLALVVGLGGFAGYLVLIGKSPFSSLEIRHLRDMKDRLDEPAAFEPMNAGDFRALPRHAPVAEYSGLERRGVVFEGYVQRLIRGPDGDFHLDLVDSLPVFQRHPYVTAEVTPLVRAGSRTWTYDGIAGAVRAWRANGMEEWHQAPRRMRVSGWLLYDFQHEDLPPDEPRVSAWEIHPVTGIELWDEKRLAWEAFAR